MTLAPYGFYWFELVDPSGRAVTGGCHERRDAMTDGLPDGLEPLIPAYLGAQRWFAGPRPPSPDSVRVERGRELWAGDDGPPALACHRGGRRTTHYQLLIGERPAGERADFLHGREEAVLGVARRRPYFYDAVLDSELARVLLEVASGGAETATPGPAHERRAVQHLAGVRRPAHPQGVPPPARRAATPTWR